MPEFGASLREADRVVILDVYAARETDDLGLSSADLVRLLPADTLTATDPGDAARVLAGAVVTGDVVLTLGAGSVTETGPILLDLLRESAAERSPNTERPRARERAEAAFEIPVGRD